MPILFILLLNRQQYREFRAFTLHAVHQYAPPMPFHYHIISQTQLQPRPLSSWLGSKKWLHAPQPPKGGAKNFRG